MPLAGASAGLRGDPHERWPLIRSQEVTIEDGLDEPEEDRRPRLAEPSDSRAVATFIHEADRQAGFQLDELVRHEPAAIDGAIVPITSSFEPDGEEIDDGARRFGGPCGERVLGSPQKAMQ